MTIMLHPFDKNQSPEARRERTDLIMSAYVRTHQAPLPADSQIAQEVGLAASSVSRYWKRRPGGKPGAGPAPADPVMARIQEHINGQTGRDSSLEELAVATGLPHEEVCRVLGETINGNGHGNRAAEPETREAPAVVPSGSELVSHVQQALDDHLSDAPPESLDGLRFSGFTRDLDAVYHDAQMRLWVVRRL